MYIVHFLVHVYMVYVWYMYEFTYFGAGHLRNNFWQKHIDGNPKPQATSCYGRIPK